jgi:hypothetical protein
LEAWVSDIIIRAARDIEASADLVYRLIADSNQHHHHFLPPAFSDYRVERGGVGAGTVVTFKLTIAGQTSSGRMEVSEPEPGRVILERDRQANIETTFTVDPIGSGHCRVEIRTRWSPRGLAAIVQRLIAPRFLRALYVDELERLNRYAREQAALNN